MNSIVYYVFKNEIKKNIIPFTYFSSLNNLRRSFSEADKSINSFFNTRCKYLVFSTNAVNLSSTLVIV